MKTVEAIYCVPGDEPLVQLFLPDGGQFGEISLREGRLEVELFAPAGHQAWKVDAEDLVHVIALARQRLAD